MTDDHRTQIARALVDVTNRWIAPNFPADHELRGFDELDEQEQRLNLDYADAAIAKGTTGWRCFHCDEVFTDKDAARLHFGDSLQGDPICQINALEGGLIKLVRDQEDELQQSRTQETASYREFYALGAEHSQALRTEEEKGYARGLADGRQLGPGWVSIENAPPGSYACVHAPDGTLKGADLSWMPADREQIPAHARRGMILPIPELKEDPKPQGA